MLKYTIKNGLLAAVTLLVLLSCVSAASANLVLTDVGTSLSAPDGEMSRQAGAHPDFTVHMDFASSPQSDGFGGTTMVPDEAVRDVEVALPPGLTGDPNVAATCSQAQLFNNSAGVDGCPANSQVGVVRVHSAFSGELVGGLQNLDHGPDAPALFGFNIQGTLGIIRAQVRPGDYGISSGSLNISQAQSLTGVSVTLWGVPSDPVHDAERGLPFRAPLSSTEEPRPFMTNPTSCSDTPSAFGVSADSWENTGAFATSTLTADDKGIPYTFDGCAQLPFAPSISVQPLSHTADAPTGLDVDVKVPQNDSPTGLASAQVRRTVVKLPLGMSVSPSAAAGLGACSSEAMGLGTSAVSSCPDSSEIGTVRIDTPLLDVPLTGDVILAAQGDNPFHSLLALYLVVQGPGVVIKLPGRVDADPVTGQLTATFDDTPQLPFSELQLDLHGGSQAPLATPPVCGTYSTHADITSWASETPVSLDTPMTIDQGCATGGFSPAFSAGSASPVAGANSPFTLAFGRQDGEQTLAGLTVALPSGLLGNVGSVPLCPEAQAAAGTCGATSQVGHLTALVGAGAAPVSIPMAGKAPTGVYLAGPYDGAPFSLSIVVPAQAGPFDLGTVVVRAALFIDPVDAHVTVRSDPLPTIVQGIPLRLRQVSVVIDRPGFILNPTSCSAKQITGAISSAQGATAGVSSRFEVGDCASLSFKPRLVASTQAKTSRANGASLTVGITAGRGEANIHAVRLQLPSLLPSRLTTLQKACTAAQFAKDPAGCLAAAFIGSARVQTPIFAHPLTGPAILVSHGGEAFPDVVFVLQGEGVTIDLVGATSIKRSTTTSTFGSVPDAPVSSFQATFPEGPHSVLAANLPSAAKGSLCSSAAKLTMPTTIVAQSGAQVTQTTKLAITGCPKAKPKTKKKHTTSKHNTKK